MESKYLTNILNISFFFFILVFGLSLLIMSGYGLNGIFLPIYFVILFAITFSIFVKRKPKQEKIWYYFKDFFNFEFEIESLFIIVVLILWISIADYFFIETFKGLQFSFADNTYWAVLFGGLSSTIFISVALTYFIGSQHFSNSLRIIILSAFFINSNLNDILYYLLFSQSLPTTWNWLIQPKFIFGNTITTNELLIWTTISLAMGIAAFVFPYELITPHILDDNRYSKLKRFHKLISYVVFISFLTISALHAGKMINGISNSVSKYVNNIQHINEQLDSKLSDQKRQQIINITINYKNKDINLNIKTIEQVREHLAKNIIFALNQYYKLHGFYPLSRGNCFDDWDSSFYSLPFEINNTVLTDPQQIYSRDCYINKNSHNILYYSDGNRFVLLTPGNITNNTKHNFNPKLNDVAWFKDNVYFKKDWGWNIPLTIYFYDNGKDVTRIFKQDHSAANSQTLIPQNKQPQLN